MNKTYSICVANWNSANTVRRWVASFLPNLTDDDEVVIVDGRSTDGSQEFLRKLCEAKGFRYASAEAHVGRQRQLAFTLSQGEYVISQVDTDDIVVSLQEAKRLYHEVVEWDPVTNQRRAFRCWGFFIMPRSMLEAIGGYPDLQFYEDQLVSYRLAIRNQLTLSVKVSAAEIGTDPKKHQLMFRLLYSFRRVREGLRLGIFDGRNAQGFLLLPPALLASLPMAHYEFRKDWWNLDVNRDEYILPWINQERLSHKLLLEKIEKVRPTRAAA
jgi:glycosyltransferase involved in cell wall biosynthesis